MKKVILPPSRYPVTTHSVHHPADTLPAEGISFRIISILEYGEAPQLKQEKIPLYQEGWVSRGFS
jgi:hypothetical protein